MAEVLRLQNALHILYVNNFLPDNTVIVSNSLLVKQKGQRGRPTLEAKRKAELNPRRTIEQFWKDMLVAFRGVFNYLIKKNQQFFLILQTISIHFKICFLGFASSLSSSSKGLTLILGNDNEHLNIAEFLKQLRYFFKKTSGQ